MKYEMTETERAARDQIKTLHARVRAPLAKGNHPTRYQILAWHFVKGSPFKRAERTNRPHNGPNPSELFAALVDVGVMTSATPKPTKGFYVPTASVADQAKVEAWLANPDGAVPAPAPRAKVMVEFDHVAPCYVATSAGIEPSTHRTREGALAMARGKIAGYRVEVTAGGADDTTTIPTIWTATIPSLPA